MPRWPLVLLMLVALPVASAQSPEATLAMTLPPGPVDMALGSEHGVPLDVTLTLQGVLCTSATQVKVPLTVKDKPSPLAGVRATPATAELVFDVPAGTYTSSAYTAKLSSTLAIRVDAGAPSNHEHAFEVTASYAGGVPSGCQGAGSMAATDASGTHAIRTGQGAPTASPASAPSHQMPDGSTMQGDRMASKDTPAPGLLAVALVLGALALARRR